MTPYAAGTGIGWFGVVRLGTVQAAIGAMVMLATSLLNRVMVVEFAIAAAVPAGLVAWHYAVQLSRPLWGHKSDRSEKRSSWIMAGMGILALGTLIAVDATIMMAGAGIFAIILAVLGFSLIGLGVGMAGTALLALLASRVAVERKPAAAAISWTMMVAGIVVAAGVSGSFLDPFSEARLAIVTSMVVLVAFCVAMLALRGLERNSLPVKQGKNSETKANFTEVLKDISQDQQARRFTYFVFISMLAYSMQDLILEPFAGFIFGMTPGESTQLAGVQHSGILLGMLVAGLGGSLYAKYFGRNEKLWIIIGCLSSAVMLGALSIAAAVGPAWPLKANVFGLGVANGIFAVAAVGAMLGLASDGSASGEGARMGVWGAAQAIAFGAGGLLGAVIVDLLRGTMADDSNAFQIVFVVEGAMFILAALVATGTSMARRELNGKAVQI
ncbi:BCD family MFS transporter [Sphingorhabdus lacus]|jgi:MFS transporter, BCD family, chlorophyll transporter|uniref:BCD family MFS transporter n=1 Tax=Sphingorhabdus lacus TaxID=392610 RepID=UPI0035939C44